MNIHDGMDHDRCFRMPQDGYVFGGFASDEWHTSSVWFGDSRCFLFTLYPKMAVYLSTGLNDHYQYLNQNQKTMPNGLVCGGSPCR